ncbi:MAG: glycosyltransferase family 25 protein [Holosporales bacterium]|nr:glycosyltransferase family 25 protein [Holosporales bacterium]
MRKKRKTSFWKRGCFLVIILCIPPFFLFEGAYVCGSRPVEIPEQKSPQGIIVYVINLDRRPDRRVLILPLAEKIGFPLERVAAIDGNLLTSEQVNQVIDAEAFSVFTGRPPTQKGEIGCALSHLHVWEAFLRSPYQYALILEDDARFDPEKIRQVIFKLLTVAQNWDIVNFDFCDVHFGMPLTLSQIDREYRHVIYIAKTLHAGAYLINRKAARALYAHALPIKMPVDLFFTRGWELGLTFTGVEPHLVHQANIGSDLWDRRNHEFSWSRIIPLTKFYIGWKVFKTKSRIMRLFYNLKRYFQLKMA